MRALDIPFVERLHYFSSPGMPSTFGTLSPSAKVPILVINEFSVWYTLSIVEYLAEEYSEVWPSEKINRAWARIESLWADGFDRFKGAWLAGDQFNAVDAFFGPVAFRFRTYGILLTDRSQAYVEKLLSHPAKLEKQKPPPKSEGLYHSMVARGGIEQGLGMIDPDFELFPAKV